MIYTHVTLYMVKVKNSNLIPVSQRKHSVTFTKVNWLTPFENIILNRRIINATYMYINVTYVYINMLGG